MDAKEELIRKFYETLWGAKTRCAPRAIGDLQAGRLILAPDTPLFVSPLTRRLGGARG
jgi:hypothetical protein